MTTRFEVGYKERLEQSRKAKNIHRLPWLGYAPYRVYEIKKKKEYTQSTITVSKSRQSGKTNWQQILWDYIDAIETLSPPQYEVRWLKSKQATLLRLQGHRVEPTTADDESTVGSVRLGK
jgi:hypothetical protein